VSWMPCTNCHAVAGGPLRFVYLNHYSGETRVQQRLKLCDGCFEGLLGDVIAVAETADVAGRWWSQEERADISPVEVAQTGTVPLSSKGTSNRSTAARRS
jgi:hypothetical protein